jgi:hypothetical protein
MGLEVRFSTDGTKMFIVGDAKTQFFEYTLSLALMYLQRLTSKSFSTASQRHEC